METPIPRADLKQLLAALNDTNVQAVPVIHELADAFNTLATGTGILMRQVGALNLEGNPYAGFTRLTGGLLLACARGGDYYERLNI